MIHSYVSTVQGLETPSNPVEHVDRRIVPLLVVLMGGELCRNDVILDFELRRWNTFGTIVQLNDVRPTSRSDRTGECMVDVGHKTARGHPDRNALDVLKF